MSKSPAGWYPQEDGRQRYWDGQSWTEHFAPAMEVAALPAEASPRTGRPWFKKKRVLIPAGVIVFAFMVNALSPGDPTEPVAATSTPSSSSRSSAPSHSSSSSSSSAAPKTVDAAAAKAVAEAKAKADAAAKAKAAADAKAKAAAEAKAKAAAALAPYNETYGTFTAVSKKGRGDAVIKLPKGASAGVVTFSHRGSSNVAASVLDSSNQPTGDLLVNEIGSYTGTTAFGLSDMGGEPTKIQITADGSWTIRIAPISSAKLLGSSAQGKGDMVFRYDGSGSDWAISHKGSSNFAVIQAGGFMPNLAVNEIGSYKGTVPFIDGPSVVTVSADGRWSMVKK